MTARAQLPNEQAADDPAPRAAPSRPRARRWRRFVVALTAIAIVLVVSLHSWLLPLLPRWLDVSDPLQTVDCAVVLGGGQSIRPFAAAEMYRRGLAKRIVVLEAETSPAEDDGTVRKALDTTLDIFRLYNVPEKDVVVLPTHVQSTRDEVRALAAYLTEHPDERLAIVTHAFHTRRTRNLFYDVCGEDANRLRFHGVPLESCHEDDWWHTPDGWKTYGTELGKLTLYYTGLDG